MKNLTGTVLNNRYRVDEFLGRGGMAEVYRVWDIHRSVNLAMKVLFPDLAEDPVFVRRFRREAKNLADLQHPNIVRFYELEKDDLLVFLTMDFIEGSTLRSEIMRTETPLSPERILEVMKSVCGALNFAHRLGVVHCDIKPANIMIHRNGTILVTDFGIARQAEGSTTATMVGAGTPAYMAPEQVRGLDPTPQTDIYSLGIVLYEMLTGGERPFTGESAEVTGTSGERVRWEQVHVKPFSPRRFNPQISPELENVVLKCLEKEPERRYAGSLELLEALQNALGETAEPAPEPKSPAPETKLPAPKPKPAPKQEPKPNKNLILFIGGGAIIVLLLLVLIKPFGNIGTSSTAIPAQNNPTLSLNTMNPSLTTEPVKVQATAMKTMPVSVIATSITNPNLSPTPTQIVPVYENGAGNSNNSGLAAKQGEWIYYRNDNDSGKIYRINKDGTKKEPVNKDNSYNINVIGDLVIYRNESDGGKIYRVLKYGGEAQKLNDSDSYYISVTDEWIYYQNRSDGDKIYRMQLDGDRQTKINNDSSFNINVYKDWIYYQNASDGKKIYKISLDGKNRQNLNDIGSYFITVADDWIYFTSSVKESQISRIRLDGTGQENLDITATSGYFNILGDSIIYIPVVVSQKNSGTNNPWIELGGITYRIKINGTEKKEINYSACTSINIVGDWVYYKKGGTGGKIYRMHLDGSGQEAVS